MSADISKGMLQFSQISVLAAYVYFDNCPIPTLQVFNKIMLVSSLYNICNLQHVHTYVTPNHKMRHK